MKNTKLLITTYTIAMATLILTNPKYLTPIGITILITTTIYTITKQLLKEILHNSWHLNIIIIKDSLIEHKFNSQYFRLYRLNNYNIQSLQTLVHHKTKLSHPTIYKLNPLNQQLYDAKTHDELNRLLLIIHDLETNTRNIQQIRETLSALRSNSIQNEFFNRTLHQSNNKPTPSPH